MSNPKKSKKCSDCTRLLESWTHKCIRHSTKCVDGRTALWDPSKCPNCIDLFNRAIDDDDDAIDVLRLMATQIRAKVTRKGTVSETIFASNELRDQYGLPFFRNTILLRDRSGSREPAAAVPHSSPVTSAVNHPSGSNCQESLAPAAVLSSPSNSVQHAPEGIPAAPLEPSPAPSAVGQEVDKLLSDLGISPSLVDFSSDAQSLGSFSSEAQSFSGFHESPASSVHSPDSIGLAASQENSQFDFNVSLNSSVIHSDSNHVSPLGSNVDNQVNSEVLSRIESNMAHLFEVFKNDREMNEARWANLDQSVAVNSKDLMRPPPAPTNFSDDVEVRRINPLSQRQSSSDNSDNELVHNSVEGCESVDLDGHLDQGVSNVSVDLPNAEIWPGFQGRTRLSLQNAEALLQADPKPVRYLLSRQDQLQHIHWDEWVSPYGKFSADEVYIASDDNLRTFVVFLGEKSARTYKAESDLKQFDPSVTPKQLPSNLKRAPLVIRTFADYAPKVPEQWSVDKDEGIIKLNGSDKTLEDLFELMEVKDKPQKMDWNLDTTSDKGKLFLDFVQGDKLSDNCHTVEGVFQRDFTRPIFPQRR